MKTAVSVPDDLFQQVDRLAARTRRSRSAVYSEALREYVDRHAPDEVTEALDRVVAQAAGSGSDAFVDRAARRAVGSADW